MSLIAVSRATDPGNYNILMVLLVIKVRNTFLLNVHLSFVSNFDGNRLLRI